MRLRYRLFGNRIDGTYAGVDATQAHLNVPATLMWAKSMESRPSRLTFVPPPDVAWTVASQLYATGDPLVFTAPNLAYLLDSPIQFGPQTLRTFRIGRTAAAGAPPTTIRLALRHDGTDAEADRYLTSIEKIVREAAGRVRRAAGVRAGALHVPRDLRAGRRRRRHGASQQHGGHGAGQPGARRPRAPRHGLARVLPRLERRAHPAALARAVRLRRRQRVVASCGSAKASPSTTAR